MRRKAKSKVRGEKAASRGALALGSEESRA